MYASLPMYDWPEVRAPMDALWAAMSGRLRAVGVDAPMALQRGGDLYAGWLRPDLLISQTCGLPFVRRLRGRVTIVGALDHGLVGLPAGFYCSRLIARRADAGPLAGFRGRRAAYNSADSQSGAGAMRHMVLPLLEGGRFFGETVMTGGHANSIRAVADGRADLAAIDAMTWELALRHMPEAAGLAVIASTPPTPGLPFITALGGPAAAVYEAVGLALADLSAGERAAIGMQAIVPRREEDFAIVAQWDAAARGYSELGTGTA